MEWCETIYVNIRFSNSSNFIIRHGNNSSAAATLQGGWQRSLSLVLGGLLAISHARLG